MSRIIIDTRTPLHKSTSHIIGANRNHLNNEKNLAGKLAAYGAIQPVFGERKKLYRLGHGPTDGRLDEPHRYMTGYHFEDYWGKDGPYPYDDLRYGLREAQAMDCDLTVVVNYGSGTPEEAGRLVSYLNRRDDPVRNAHGDPPWNVTYFELGNEVTWRMQVGHDPYALTPETYAARAREFAREMRKNSDIPIKIGMVGSINGSWLNDDWPNDESGDRLHNLDPILDIMGEEVDFFIYHGYPQFTGSDFEIMASNQWFSDKLRKKIFPTIAEGVARNRISHPVEVANSEFFSATYDSDHRQGVLEALYGADSMVTALNLDIKMAVGFCFSFAEHNANAQDLFFLNDDPAQPSALFSVHKLAAESLGDTVVRACGEGIPGRPMEGLDGGMLDALSFAATLCADGSAALLLVNRLEEPVCGVEIDAGFPPSRAVMKTLEGLRYANRQMPLTERALPSLQSIDVPAASVSVVRIFP